MNKERTLILIEADLNVEIFYRDWIENGYNAAILFKRVSKPLRALRRIWMRYNLPYSNIWYGEWYKDVEKYTTIIIHMNRLTLYFPKNIINQFPSKRIIGWYWNTIDELNKPIEFHNPNIEYWSFDENDCNKYHLHKNIQYYCPQKTNTNVKKENDIYYIGRNRNRADKITEIKNIAEKQGLKCKFNIIDDKSNEIIPYIDIRKEIEKTRAVLEINKKNQVGFTLRTLESLFYGVKLITDNKEITKSKIYNPNNIFIVGEDNVSNLSAFVKSDFDHSVDPYRKDFCLDAWFKNFFVKE